MTYKDIERRAYLIGHDKGEEKGRDEERKEIADVLISKGLVSPENLAAVLEELDSKKK